jgi:hypothetical protein
MKAGCKLGSAAAEVHQNYAGDPERRQPPDAILFSAANVAPEPSRQERRQAQTRIHGWMFNGIAICNALKHTKLSAKCLLLRKRLLFVCLSGVGVYSVACTMWN